MVFSKTFLISLGFYLACVTLTLSQTTSEPGGRCQCGIFVDKMYPGLSRIEPLDYVGEGDIALTCSLSLCKGVCDLVAPLWDYDLDILETDGRPRGQHYCEAVYELITGNVNAEPLFVTTRVPDCDSFLVWSTEKIYISNSTLCCSGGNYSPC